MTIDQQQRNRKERKELARRLRSEGPGLEVVHPHAAGVDVGNSAHYVAARPDRDSQPVRRFECFTADLHRFADWLQSGGVKTVALQSTGVDWIPLYDILEERGFEVCLVNARHTKNLPGRKSDVQESQFFGSLKRSSPSPTLPGRPIIPVPSSTKTLHETWSRLAMEGFIRPNSILRRAVKRLRVPQNRGVQFASVPFQNGRPD